MVLYAYDVEVFKHNWIVVFKELKTKQYHVFVDDQKSLKEFINNTDLYMGFNTKYYDQWIIKAIATGAHQDTIKNLNDWIISGNPGREHWCFKGKYFTFQNLDIRDDMQKGLSLKAIEGHLGLPIIESPISFDIDRPLTHIEIEKSIQYCKYDVDSTENLIQARKGYLDAKLSLGAKANLLPGESLALTNANLTAEYLGAKKVERFDGREYKFPTELKQEYIPEEVLNFFKTIRDVSVPWSVVKKTKLDIDLVGCDTRFSWGGVHGTKTKYYAQSDVNYIIVNDDVSSMYPNVMVQYNYMSRNIESPKRFIDTLERRMWAKENNHPDKNILKLPLNTASGAGEASYNAMYDELNTRSLRITCQLLMCEFVVRLKEACPSFELINFNTDGAMYRIRRNELPKANAVSRAWQQEKRLTLERTNIIRVWIKDVNNLLAEIEGGEIQKVGGYLNKGISEKSGFNINNNWIVVSDALEQYLLHGIAPEVTIKNEQDIHKFMYIAKSSGKYSDPFQLVNGIPNPIQKVNRVYATKDTRLGTLYHTNIKTGSVAKQAGGLPKHCVIDNDNKLSVNDIDKNWYVTLAWKRIHDYTGNNRLKQLSFI